MASPNQDNQVALIPTAPEEVQAQLIPKLKGASGTIKASEEASVSEEKHKKVVKDEGNKHIEQKASSLTKEDSSRSAQATIKTTNEGGVKRTVQTTVVTSSSSFEQEEHFEEHTTTGGIKCIKEN